MIFWAYHYDHLDLLEQYVRAKLREGSRKQGSKNSLMFIACLLSQSGNRRRSETHSWVADQINGIVAPKDKFEINTLII
jgi:hypothetical protein